MWIRVLSDKDYWPSARRMLSFKKGFEGSVKKDIGEAGIKDGWAEEIPTPPSENATNTETSSATADAGAGKAKK